MSNFDVDTSLDPESILNHSMYPEATPKKLYVPFYLGASGRWVFGTPFFDFTFAINYKNKLERPCKILIYTLEEKTKKVRKVRKVKK
jgi:hypothetical protein